MLENGLHDARAAFDHAEVAVAPAGDAGVGEHAKDNAARGGAEIVNGVSGKFGRGQAQQICLDTGDLDLFFGFGGFCESAAQGCARSRAPAESDES